MQEHSSSRNLQCICMLQTRSRVLLALRNHCNRVQGWRLLQVVHSRALAVPGPDGVVVPMLVPMVDMFNHGNYVGSSIPDLDSEPSGSSNVLAQDAAGPSENVRCAPHALRTAKNIEGNQQGESTYWKRGDHCTQSCSGRSRRK